MDQITLSDEQLSILAVRIAEANTQHACRFSEDEARSMHRFAQTMSNGGWDKFSAILDFGETLRQVKKAGVVAVVGVFVVAAVLTTVLIGARACAEAGCIATTIREQRE